MVDHKSEQLSQLIRNIEAEKGTTELLRLFLTVLRATLFSVKITSLEEFYLQLHALITLLKNTKPKIALLIHYTCEFWDIMSDEREQFTTLQDVQARAEGLIEAMLDENAHDNHKLLRYGLSCIENGDRILVHSHSRIVLRVLARAKEEGKDFSIIVAEQNEEKTNDIIAFLQDLGIPFCVVPEFMLSHIEEEITKVFLGCVTYNYQKEFVTDAGTNSVVAELHHAEIPIYMFFTTKKFSLWKSTATHHTHKMVQKRALRTIGDVLTYERIKFSHDRLKSTLIDHVITEERILTPSEVHALYLRRFEDRTRWVERHMKSADSGE